MKKIKNKKHCNDKSLQNSLFLSTMIASWNKHTSTLENLWNESLSNPQNVHLYALSFLDYVKLLDN